MYGADPRENSLKRIVEMDCRQTEDKDYLKTTKKIMEEEFAKMLQQNRKVS